MDKKSVIGFVLIGIILITWMMWSSKSQKPQEQVEEKNKETIIDTTIARKDSVKDKDTISVIKQEISADSVNGQGDKILIEEFGTVFYKSSVKYKRTLDTTLNQKIAIIENDHLSMEFTNFGGCLHKVQIKGFNTWDGHPVKLIDYSKERELSLLFTSKEGKLINSKDLYFVSDYNNWDKKVLTGNDSFKLRFQSIVGDDSSSKIIKTYTFYADKYDFNVEYELFNPVRYIADGKYQVLWGSALNLTEYRSDEEATFSEGFAYMGGELVEMHPSDFDKEEINDLNGNTDFVATRNKFFGLFIIPLSRKGDGAYLTGNKIKLPDSGQKNLFSIAVKMDVKNDLHEKSSFKIIPTPIDYNILKSYDRELEITMRFALDFIVRPIAQYMIIPFFTFLHSFIPNYGLVIIIFAICLKILLNPLTKKQMDSMKRMGQLNPKITAIREKYKDDPAKMNSAIMKLYKEEGINPMGGCLPLLLQLPILYALFGVFRSTIELRQAEFIWWIKDLSSPDVIFNLPFKIPLFGIDQVSGLATLMGITMFIQQKMTVTDPKQKSFVYIMPVMLTLLFFSFPSGLNLYYFVFNLLSIAQQIYTTKFKPAEENIPKKPVKPGFGQRLLKKIEERQRNLRK